jgi:hypothetical protein
VRVLSREQNKLGKSVYVIAHASLIDFIEFINLYEHLQRLKKLRRIFLSLLFLSLYYLIFLKVSRRKDQEFRCCQSSERAKEKREAVFCGLTCETSEP